MGPPPEILADSFCPALPSVCTSTLGAHGLGVSGTARIIGWGR